MNSYKDAIHYLYSFISYERDPNWKYSDKTFNLQRFRDFLATLGNPQYQCNTIHVAGSDGKGSVCAMISSVLQTMGYKVGLYVSPHLENIRERISIGGEWISEQDFTFWAGELQKLRPPETIEPAGYATFFELMTAMAFLYFAQNKVDFAVIETGLGGRLDATNVLQPLITVITHISMEHTDKLGNTLEAIADEKLGITKTDVPAVIGHQDSSLYRHFRKRFSSHQASVIIADETYQISDWKPENGTRALGIFLERGKFKNKNTHSEIRLIHLPLFGHYQIENAVTAIAALDILADSGTISSFSEENLDRGMRNLVWPGRFEIRKVQLAAIQDTEISVVMDVAHTEKGASSLRLSLDEVFPHLKRIFIMGFLKGKNISSMVSNLVRPQDQIFITQAPSPRGESIEMIRQTIAKILSVPQPLEAISDPLNAYKKALEKADANSIIVITGSLYLVGQIRRMVFSSQT